MINQGKAKSANTNTKQLQQKEKKSEKLILLIMTSQNCRICEGDHRIYKCEKLLQQKKEITDREETLY